MSKFQESLKRANETTDGVGFIAGAFRERWPLLAEAMFGVPAEGDKPVVWRCSVNLFWEGDRLKFCLNPKSGPKICFGTIRDALDGFDGIEEAIREDHLEWKPRGKR